MQRVIHLPMTGKRVSIGVYVRGVRTAIANPEQTFKHGLETWWQVGGAEIRREFRLGIADRINRHIPNYGVGRKHKRDWQNAASRVASNLNGQRIVTRERDCPKELRGKLAHRLMFPDDE
jgi:hypothetical protein